jgi:hypothetical protein
VSECSVQAAAILSYIRDYLILMSVLDELHAASHDLCDREGAILITFISQDVDSVV